MQAIDCRFLNNRALRGGAIVNTNGWLTLINCVLSNNVASDNVASGSGGFGGAIHSVWGDLVVSNCTFVANRADGPPSWSPPPQALPRIVSAGGAMYVNTAGQVHVVNTTFADNQAGAGATGSITVL